MPGYLGNFPNAWVGIWEIPKKSKFLMEFYGGVFKIFEKFPKCLSIWEISQLPGYLGNF